MIKNQRNKDGKQHGYWEEYHANGKLSSKGDYKDGKERGLFVEYYSNGDKLCKAYYSNGDIWYKGKFKDGKQDGYWEFSNQPSKITIESRESLLIQFYI